jgi:hypothetical protein
MDPMYDIYSLSNQRREEQIREAQMRSLAKQAKGDHKTPFKRSGVGSILSSLLGVFR